MLKKVLPIFGIMIAIHAAWAAGSNGSSLRDGQKRKEKLCGVRV